MAPKKLTEADKAVILGLYRQPEETTSTLADRYGVSNSTISRLLKSSLPAEDYKRLIQQKRGTGDRDPSVTGGDGGGEFPSLAETLGNADGGDSPLSPEGSAAITDPDSTPQTGVVKAPPILKKRSPSAPVAVVVDSTEAPTLTAPEEASPEASRSRRRRARALDEASPAVEEVTQLALATENLANGPAEADAPSPRPSRKVASPVPTKAAALEDAWDGAPSLDDDYDEDDEDDEEDDEAWDGDTSELAPHLEAVEIIPLTPNDLPSQCYLVVERVSSELVVLPLKTFASLGQIPDEEGDLRTLPVFDNHRIARRFSRRNQRVIKVPDGALLQTTRPYLQAKGITRLLIDGQVFSLEDQVEAAP